MIVNHLDTRHDIATVTPEDSDDLWTLRRVITKGDYVTSETTRVLKEVAEFSRPDKERIRVKLTLDVEQVKLDSTLSRLRISGRITEVSNDLLTKNSFHSLSISEGKMLSIRKSGGFSPLETKLIAGSRGTSDSYAIVALDMREAGVGVVKGTHLHILPTIDSGIPGKMYQEGGKKKPSNYFENVANALAIIYPAGVDVYVLGPGNTKNTFANYLAQRRKEFASVKTLEGGDVSGEDGVFLAIRNQNLQAALGETRLSKASQIVNEIMRRISLGDSRAALAFKDNLSAARGGAVESLLVSDQIFSQKDVDEDLLVELLNLVENYRGETFLLDSSTDVGSQINSLGGIVGLLRFPQKAS